jgi:hypothetical protein
MEIRVHVKQQIGLVFSLEDFGGIEGVLLFNFFLLRNVLK